MEATGRIETVHTLRLVPAQVHRRRAREGRDADPLFAGAPQQLEGRPRDPRDRRLRRVDPSRSPRRRGVPLIDLNDLVAGTTRRSARTGVARDFFYADRTHTSPAGAQVTALTVVEALRALPGQAARAVLLDDVLRRDHGRPTSREEWDDPAVLHLNTRTPARDDDGVPDAGAGARRAARRRRRGSARSTASGSSSTRRARRQARRVRARLVRRHGVAGHPGAGELGAAGIRHAHLQQLALPVRVRPEQPAARRATTTPSARTARVFEVPPDWHGRRVLLHFDGVDSAFYVWVNGRRVGYNEDSRTPAEFDITTHVRPGPNVLAVEVYRWSDGVVPRRPGHVPAERHLPRRVPVEHGAAATSATSRSAPTSTRRGATPR